MLRFFLEILSEWGVYFLIVFLAAFAIYLLIASIRLHDYTGIKLRGNRDTAPDYKVEIIGIKTGKEPGNFFEEEMNNQVQNARRFVPDALKSDEDNTEG